MSVKSNASTVGLQSRVPAPGADKRKKKIAVAALTAARRTEKYSFKSKNHTDLELMMSIEMETIARSKSELIESSTGKWTDRNSILAAPLGAELFLQCDRGADSVMLGAPRFYLDELSIANELPDGTPVPPDARSRFPYSSEAHEAAKKLSFRLARNVMLRNYSADVLQRVYRGYAGRRAFRKRVTDCHTAARKLQWFWRKRLGRVRQKRAKIEFRQHCAIVIQCMVRRALARMKLPVLRRRLLNRRARQIQRFMRFAGTKKRRDRGITRRRWIHTVRIQALWRRAIVRKALWTRHGAARWIWYIFRRFWKRKYVGKGRVIMNYLRRRRLRRLVISMQRVVRGFVGRQRAHRRRLLMLSRERLRLNAELAMLERALNLSITRDKDYSWYDPIFLYFSIESRLIVSSNMHMVDSSASSFSVY